MHRLSVILISPFLFLNEISILAQNAELRRRRLTTADEIVTPGTRSYVPFHIRCSRLLMGAFHRKPILRKGIKASSSRGISI